MVDVLLFAGLRMISRRKLFQNIAAVKTNAIKLPKIP